jgi:type I restriction enzyme S subunit
MKEGWTSKKLGEVCDVICGQSPDGKSYNNDGNGTPFYQGKKDFTFKYIGVPTMWTTTATKFAEKGDLLMSVRAPVGDVNFATQRVCIGRGLAAIRSKGILDKDYLFYFLLAKKSSIKGKEGVGFASINKGDIMDIDIEYPVQSKQVHIVSRLDAAFSHIDELKANAEKQLSEARALFQKSLEKAMEPKDGWKKIKLNELTSEIGDGLHGTPTYCANGDYFFVNGNNLENGIIEIKENTKRVSHEEFEKYKLNLNANTVFLSINGTIGKTAFYNGEPIILGKSACYINVLPSLLKDYLRYYLLSDSFMNYAKRNSRQATIVNLGLKEIRSMPIPVPSTLSEQQRIVERLDALSTHVRDLEENQKKIISECDALKQALLRKVFE